MSLTKSTQTLPLSAPVTQNVLEDGSSNIYPAEYNVSNSGGSKKTALPSSAGAVISSSPGRACRIHIPGTGGTLGAVTLYDNATAASGTIIFGPTTPSAGEIIDLQVPVDNGIYAVTASATTGFITYD